MNCGMCVSAALIIADFRFTQFSSTVRLLKSDMNDLQNSFISPLYYSIFPRCKRMFSLEGVALTL